MTEAQKKKTAPGVETKTAASEPDAEVRGPVLGEQQNYEPGDNPSDKGASGTYPQGDAPLVRNAAGQVWPADNRDAFPEQDEKRVKAAERAAKEGHGADAPELIPPAQGVVADGTEGPTVADLQATRVENS